MPRTCFHAWPAFPRTTNTEVVVTIRWIVPVAIGRAQVPRIVVPAPAANNAVRCRPSPFLQVERLVVRREVGWWGKIYIIHLEYRNFFIRSALRRKMIARKLAHKG